MEKYIAGRDCTKCKEWKDRSEFVVNKHNKSTGLQSWCKDCYNSFKRAIKTENNRRNKIYKQKLRKDVFILLGGKCSCCGESRYEFLSLDHVNGQGNTERLKLGGQDKVYKLLRRGLLPLENYTVLCFNCNCAKGFHGVCPHCG